MHIYTVSSWKANNETVDDAGNYILIKGRQAGLFGFILAKFKLGGTITLSISGESITWWGTSIFGTARLTIPLENCCSTCYGYGRPLKSAIVLGIISATILGALGRLMANNVQSQATAVILGALAGIILGIIYYLLKKTLFISFVEMSGHESGAMFSGSFIEGIVVDEKSVSYVVTLTQALIDARVTARAIVNPPSN